MAGQKTIIPIGQIEQRILLIRGQKIMLDVDLADLYGTTTKWLNEQIVFTAGKDEGNFVITATVGGVTGSVNLTIAK
ncbi:MAG: hypothetical protein A2026_22185 [Deltaproteobacteria bacterium RBG_19FT_COMBO_46_12]|nr:MAG: hypothetical protein A2026_22185 [Deltaproteobacteria bacterium RBG_19FT_COMBO_46_12]